MAKKIGILLENRFIDQEIIYYSNRFAEEGIQVDFLTRLWGNKELKFKGIELGMEITVNKSFENLTPDELAQYSAIIVPAGYVADMLRYSENPAELAPAVKFMQEIMNNKAILKCIICHSFWIFDFIPESIRGRKLTCHNNLLGSVRNTGAIYVNQDVVVDDDLVSTRVGSMFSKLAHQVISEIKKRDLVNV